jgi:iron complex transport system substrate-binding protein
VPRSLLAVLAIALALAGCGSSDDSSSEAGGTATRTVTDLTGTRVEVPAEPKRVVAAGETELDAALALGVKPVATIGGRGQQGPPRYLGARAAGIPLVGDVTGPIPDRVLEHDPDLILLQFEGDPKVLEQLRKIAPVVVTGQEAGDWKKDFTRTAEALNRAGEGRKLMAEYDDRARQASQELGDHASETVSIVRWDPKQPAFIPESVFASRVVTEDLGLERPPRQRGKRPAHSSPVSLENLSVLDGDRMFVGTLTTDGPDVKALEAAEGTPAFRALDAVKEDHVTRVDGSYWGSRGGLLAAGKVIDDVTGAMNGGS